ncbi:hypothetical protein [Nocardia africana]|uniref:Uncharacterized protein n=1 Tax=Nocardia africana TaxID=134964 RepID=A0ABW6NVU0_9NOCA
MPDDGVFGLEHHTTWTNVDEELVVCWPDPSPLEAWWNTIMTTRPANHPVPDLVRTPVRTGRRTPPSTAIVE